MTRKEIKDILMSMRTQENGIIINKLLGKLDLIDEESLQNAVKQVGETQDAVKAFFKKKLTEKQQHNSEEHKPINEMFSYGIFGNCIHLHLPMDLHQMIAEKGISGTIDTVNLNLLDAINKITRLRNEGFYKFQDKDSLYMISPILLGRELKFLNGLDFETNTYKKKQLSDEQFVQDNSEAMLATQIFGKGQNVGTAKIKFDTIQTKEWQEKKQKVVKGFEEKGITLQDNKSMEK